MGSSRFFGRPHGRFFNVKDEIRRIDRDMELYQGVYGTEVLWFFYVSGASVIDDVYDEGSVTNGKVYEGPLRVPVLSALNPQGAESPDDQGFATYDNVTLRLSYEQSRRAGLVLDPNKQGIDPHLLDRFVYRGSVFDVTYISTAGHFDQTSRDTVIEVKGTQLRPDELMDSPTFAKYSG